MVEGDQAKLVRWIPNERIDSPCADISVSREPPYALQVRMRFSNVVGGPRQDLLIIFDGAIALSWAEECFDSVSTPHIALPIALPTIESGKTPRWTYPLLICESSKWTIDVANFPPYENRIHYVLISMNDIVEVLALPDARAEWVEPIP